VLKLPVTLSAAAAGEVKVEYATADGSATSTAPGDYASKTGTVTFDAGQTERFVNITINGDVAPEPDETFTVTLSAPSGAAIVDGAGVGPITDDD
jgi:chitinase